MKLNVTETGMQIIPESPQDIIYIQEFLGLRNENDYARCERKNAGSLSCMVYLEIKPK